MAAARKAFEDWRSAPLTRRQNVMFAYRELITRHRLDLARTLTAEHGKTLDDALGEVQRGLEVVEFACNIAHLLKGDYSEQVSTSVDTYTIRQPLGVVAGSPRSTSRPWSRCGCSRSPSPAGTPSC